VVTPAFAATRPLVLKIGGRALEAPGAAEDLAREIAAIQGSSVIVHGGGSEVTAWCERFAIEPRFERGLRVTDAATLEVVVAVLAGLANKRLVAGLRNANVDAIGLSGVDGGTLEVEPHPDAATLGAVGAVTAVSTALLDTLLAQGAVPVLASVSAQAGALLNVNADDAAAALAPALRARALVLLSDTPGLVLAGEHVPSLDRDGLAAAIRHPDVQGGMLPKLLAARRALDAGVPRVVIGAWGGPGSLARLLSGEGAATTLTYESNVTQEATHG